MNVLQEMLLEFSTLYEEEQKGIDTTEEFKRALLMAFPSEKTLKRLFGKQEEEEIQEAPLDSEEMQELEDILRSLNVGSDLDIPLIEQEG